MARFLSQGFVTVRRYGGMREVTPYPALAAQLPSQAHFFKADALPGRFTPAGPDHAQVAAVNGVIGYLEAVAARHGHGQRSVQEQSAAVRYLFREHETELL
jgi:hypothetical protein